MNESLVNNGIIRLRDEASQNPSTVVVVGSARGGTSLIAGVLYHLGVFMGRQALPPVFEDVELSEYLESSNLKSAKALIAQYSQEHTLWGWKRPSSINYLKTVDKVFDKPLYIFIYKDIVSIAQRNAISMLQDVVSSMSVASANYEKSLKFIKASQCDALLVSYEKAISSPDTLVDEVIQFCQLQVSTDQRSKAIAFISPNPSEYLDKSRITTIKGYLDGVVNGRISGWARYTHSSMASSTVKVALTINDSFIAEVAATEFRKDLDAQFQSDCAFDFILPPAIKLKTGDVIQARAVGEANDLENSPFSVA